MPTHTTAELTFEERYELSVAHRALAGLAQETNHTPTRKLAETVIDRDLIAWSRDEDARSEKPSQIFYALNEAYATMADVGSPRAQLVLGWIEQLRDHDDTPGPTRQECTEFLSDPEAWPQVRGYRQTGHFVDLSSSSID